MKRGYKIGIGVTVAILLVMWVAGAMIPNQELTTDPQEQEIQATREAEERKYQAELERQREAEERKYQAELERQRDLESSNTKFDTELVEAAKENIPLMQSLPREILEQCRAVKSYSDYQTFLIVVGIMSGELVENLETMDTLLTTLEIQGYDKHPEVGPLIKETRNVAMRASDCMNDLIRKYGN